MSLATAYLAEAVTAINPDKTWRAVRPETEEEPDGQEARRSAWQQTPTLSHGGAFLHSALLS